MTAERSAGPTEPVLDDMQAGSAPTATGAGVAVARRRIVNGLWIAVAAVLALGLLHLALADSIADPTARRFFDLLALDGEQCLPAWFASMMMAAAALLMAAAGLAARRFDEANARPWFILAAIFVYFSFDEAALVHEKIGELIGRFHTFGGVLTFAWVVAAAPLLVLGAFAFTPFLRRLPAPAGRRLFTAGLVFAAGAYGCELVGGYLYSTGGRTVWYWVEVVAEEALEMAGLVLAIGAILGYLATVAPRFTLHFVD
jgi:hypothetical protein